MFSLDTYSFRARAIPVLVVVVPPLVLLGASVVSGTRLGTATSVVMTVIAALAGQLGRDRGRALQTDLWESWGGSPTLRRMRFRGNEPKARVGRLHVRLNEVLGEGMPTESDEQANPNGADARYEDAVGRIIARTRDRQRFPLVFAENVNYGQRRNLLGLRGIGISVAGVTLVASTALLAFGTGGGSTRVSNSAPSIAVALLALFFWTRLVTPSWVRVPAEAYADRLIESVELL